jgi:hypothetical protein
MQWKSNLTVVTSTLYSLQGQKSIQDGIKCSAEMDPSF